MYLKKLLTISFSTTRQIAEIVEAQSSSEAEPDNWRLHSQEENVTSSFHRQVEDHDEELSRAVDTEEQDLEAPGVRTPVSDESEVDETQSRHNEEPVEDYESEYFCNFYVCYT